MSEISIGLLVVVVVQRILGMYREYKLKDEYNHNVTTTVNAWFDERLEWTKERQQLLDRIQASSFAEYKTQEIRVIKAQTGEKEPPKLEQL